MNSNRNVGANEPQFSHFDTKHWYRVKAERSRLGLHRATEVGAEVQHALVGRTLVEQDTGDTYRVQNVTKDWYHGWFLRAFLVSLKNPLTGSHRVCHVENISCQDEGIQQQIEHFHTTLSVVA
jgi:hypothetical protein